MAPWKDGFEESAINYQRRAEMFYWQSRITAQNPNMLPLCLFYQRQAEREAEISRQYLFELLHRRGAPFEILRKFHRVKGCAE